uniref:Uncharacterized protein LOC109506418 n=1 Tax=Elaeis guineensis var. tenera TaxID=51953 RepID=A0A6J0PP75_ELAGV|nr:uncharacterized protein LOC109506418 [Elaeis guineensis]
MPSRISGDDWGLGAVRRDGENAASRRRPHRREGEERESLWLEATTAARKATKEEDALGDLWGLLVLGAVKRNWENAASRGGGHVTPSRKGRGGEPLLGGCHCRSATRKAAEEEMMALRENWRSFSKKKRLGWTGHIAEEKKTTRDNVVCWA